MDFLSKYGGYMGILLAAALFCMIGEMVYKGKKYAGARVVVHIAGVFPCTVGGMVMYFSWPALAINNYPKAVLFYMGSALLVFGFVFIALAFLGSDERVESWCDKIINSLKILSGGSS